MYQEIAEAARGAARETIEKKALEEKAHQGRAKEQAQKRKKMNLENKLREWGYPNDVEGESVELEEGVTLTGNVGRGVSVFYRCLQCQTIKSADILTFETLGEILLSIKKHHCPSKLVDSEPNPACLKLTEAEGMLIHAIRTMMEVKSDETE